MTVASTKAKALLTELNAGIGFTIPTVDLSANKYTSPTGNILYGEIEKIDIKDFTEGKVNGTGIFDAMMHSVSIHVKAEYEKGRITGSEYTKVYIAALESAMNTSLQFLLSKETAYWQAVQAQIQTITANVELESAKVNYANLILQGQLSEAEHALTTLRLATEDMNHEIAVFNHDNILPAQHDLLKEQMEVQHAQTSDNRTDGPTVQGSLGKQKELYTQQITSYQRDAEVKAARLFSDAWITQKTIDEGLIPPDAFANASLQTILETIKSSNGLN